MARILYIINCIGWRTAGAWARRATTGYDASGYTCSFHMRREQPSLSPGLSSPQRRLSARRDNQHHLQADRLAIPFSNRLPQQSPLPATSAPDITPEQSRNR